jgi:hypothetical protein
MRVFEARAGTGVVLAALLGVASCATCAPRQRVSIDSAPRDATVFIDGEPAGSPPLQVDLRADKDHSVFFKRKGYRPELVILRSQPGDPRPVLEPDDVRVSLVPLERGRDVEVEVEPKQEGTPLDPDWKRRGPP